MLAKYKLPKDVNYVAAFLTLRCNFNCTYCINRHGEFDIKGDELSTDGWIDGLSRLELPSDTPVTLQGGEPTIHPGCWKIAKALKTMGTNVDILTNGSFDLHEFVKYVPYTTFKRPAKYASIRVSYHPHTHDAHALATKVLLLLGKGYHIGIWGIDHPNYGHYNNKMAEICKTMGIDFRLKEFLGYHSGIRYGTLKYPDACDGKKHKTVKCRTTELLIGPSGHIYRCHSDLYANRQPIGHILDEKMPDIRQWRTCKMYGWCNECDTKWKTNRFQESGHCSVEIKT